MTNSNRHRQDHSALVLGRDGALFARVTRALDEAEVYYHVVREPGQALSVLSGLRFPNVIVVSAEDLPADYEAILPQLAEAQHTRTNILINGHATLNSPRWPSFVQFSAEALPEELIRAIASTQ